MVIVVDFIIIIRYLSYLFDAHLIVVIRCSFYLFEAHYYHYPILILARIEIRVFRKTFITRSVISLSLFEDHFIIIILRSTYCRYLTFILLSLLGFDFRENRNPCFIKTLLLCVRESHYCYSMFIIRSIISLSLFDTHFNYPTLISLSLFDFDFRENSNSCFLYTFIMRPIISLLLFNNHFIYSTFDV